MMGWKEVLLSDFYTISSGLSKPASEFGSGFPFLSFKDVFWNYFVPDELTELVNTTEIEKEKCSVKKGDIFLTRTSEKAEELGLSCVALKNYPEATFNGFTKRLRPKIQDSIDPVFIGFYLRSPYFRAEITAFSNLITRASLNNGAINRLKIKIPSIDTQRQIGEILMNYNKLIENNLRRIKLLEELAQRTYEEWFVKFTINGQKLPLNEETGLPEGWVRKPFNSIVEIVSGFAFKSGDYVKDGKYRIVTIKNVQDGVFIPITTDSLYKIPPKIKESQKLRTGDFILSLTGNVGRTCIVYGNNFLLNQRVAKIIPKQNSLIAFIYCFLRNKSSLVVMENLSNGAAQQNLSPINLGKMEINAPSKDLIEEFGSKFNNAIEEICSLNIQNSLLKESRNILLPRLMSGKINVEEAKEQMAMAAEPLEKYEKQ